MRRLVFLALVLLVVHTALQFVRPSQAAAPIVGDGLDIGVVFDVGVTYHVGAWNGEVAGWRTRIDHGDGLRDVEDRRYRLLRGVLRHPWSIRAFRWIHPDLGSRIALGSSQASRTYRARDGGEGLRVVAHRQLEAMPGTDLLVYGHSHVPILERGPAGVYANAGTWMDDTTFLTIREDAIRLHRWSEATPEEELAAVPRVSSVTTSAR